MFSPRHFPLHASRILELLRLMDPDSQDRLPAGSSEDEEVSGEAIAQLEDRVEKAEVRPQLFSCSSALSPAMMLLRAVHDRERAQMLQENRVICRFFLQGWGSIHARGHLL